MKKWEEANTKERCKQQNTPLRYSNGTHVSFESLGANCSKLRRLNYLGLHSITLTFCLFS